MGGRFFIAGSDVTYLQSAARADAKALRGTAENAWTRRQTVTRCATTAPCGG